jgi:hypothetical protein
MFMGCCCFLLLIAADCVVQKKKEAIDGDVTGNRIRMNNTS